VKEGAQQDLQKCKHFAT